MEALHLENTLFLGNGFSRVIFQNIPSWGSLYDGENSKIRNYAFLYEAFRQSPRNRKRKENIIKEELIQKIRESISENNINSRITNLDQFGSFLVQSHITNILTTNYDNGIELILSKKCGYREEKQEFTSERIYSIRTYKFFYNDKTNHGLKLWKIHGDIGRIQSITLGFDQYCGSLWKLNDYVKGQYKSSKDAKAIKCDISMSQKCEERKFDGISWAELFFNSNVFVVGFGMDLSEIDIWWLLNKRARIMLENHNITNQITYLYNPEYDSPTAKAEIFSLLDAFGVATKPLQPKSEEYYLSELFNNIAIKDSHIIELEHDPVLIG